MFMAERAPNEGHSHVTIWGPLTPENMPDGVDPAELNWITRSMDGQDGGPEIAGFRTRQGKKYVVMRDSRCPDVGAHMYTEEEWLAFLMGVYGGEFDDGAELNAGDPGAMAARAADIQRRYMDVRSENPAAG